jgi:hypothetical protein
LPGEIDVTTEPTIWRLSKGGREGSPCTMVRMYGNECRVSADADKWVVEAPFSFDTWAVWAASDSRDAALVLAGEYLRESRGR